MKMLRIVLNPAFKQLAGFVSDLTRDGVPVKAKKIYDIRNKVYVYTVKGITLNIKSFKKPGLLQGIVYSTLRKSKARRSYENARQLMRMGFDTPTPIGYIEIRKGCVLKQSYYLSVQVDANDVRSARGTDKALTVEDAVAELMAQMHEAGVWHKDFTDRNVLYTIDADGRPHLMLIDLNRMAFNIKNRNKLMRNFARIYGDSAAETASLARRYAEKQGLDPEQTAAKAVTILNKHLRAKRRNHRIKSIFQK